MRAPIHAPIHPSHPQIQQLSAVVGMALSAVDRMGGVGYGSDGGYDGDDGVSCFTYLSVLGGGWVVCGGMFFIQVAIPSILWKHSTDQYSDAFGGQFYTNLCNRDGSDDNKTLIFAVFLIYVLMVVPSQWQLHGFLQLHPCPTMLALQHAKV